MEKKRPNIFSLIAAICLLVGLLLPFGRGGTDEGKNLFLTAGAVSSENVTLFGSAGDNRTFGIVLTAVLFGGLFLLLIIDFFKKLLILKYILLVLCSGILYFICLKGGILGSSEPALIQNAGYGLYTILAAFLLVLVSAFTYSGNAWKSRGAVAAAVITGILYLGLVGGGVAFGLNRTPATGTGTTGTGTTGTGTTGTGTTGTGTTGTGITGTGTTKKSEFPGPEDQVYINYLDDAYYAKYKADDIATASNISSTMSTALANETAYDEIMNAAQNGADYILEIRPGGEVTGRSGTPLDYTVNEVSRSLGRVKIKYTERGADHWLVSVKDYKPVVYVADKNETKIWKLYLDKDPEYSTELGNPPAGFDEWAIEHKEWIETVCDGGDESTKEKFEGVDILSAEEQKAINFYKAFSVPDNSISFDEMMKKGGTAVRWSIQNYEDEQYTIRAYAKNVDLSLPSENGQKNYQKNYTKADVQLEFNAQKKDDGSYLTTSYMVYVNESPMNDFYKAQVLNCMCK